MADKLISDLPAAGSAAADDKYEVLTAGGVAKHVTGAAVADLAQSTVLTAANTFTIGPQTIQSGDAANVALAAQGAASQSADLVQVLDSAASILLRIDKGGYIVISRTSAPADGDLAAGDLALWFDDQNTTPALKVKAKKANGSVVTGTVLLT